MGRLFQQRLDDQGEPYYSCNKWSANRQMRANHTRRQEAPRRIVTQRMSSIASKEQARLQPPHRELGLPFKCTPRANARTT